MLVRRCRTARESVVSSNSAVLLSRCFLPSDGAYQAYLLIPGSEPFSYSVTVLDNDQGTVGALAIADVTGDGMVEVFVPNYDKGYLNVWTFGN